MFARHKNLTCRGCGRANGLGSSTSYTSNRQNWCVHPALQSTAHRPWPLPGGNWTMSQTWHDLLFAHWPMKAETLRPFVPAELPLDTWEGQCWVGVVPFHMSDIHRRGLPPLPGLSRFPELNVRTYVTVGVKPGVYFFSLDAANLPAIWAARRFYHLPYFHASMSTHAHGDWIHYESVRRNQRTEFRGRYRPRGPVVLRNPHSLEGVAHRAILPVHGSGRPCLPRRNSSSAMAVAGR